MVSHPQGNTRISILRVEQTLYYNMGWTTMVQLLAGAQNFSLCHHVLTGSGAHPASYLMGTRSSFLGGKAVGA